MSHYYKACRRVFMDAVVKAGCPKGMSEDSWRYNVSLMPSGVLAKQFIRVLNLPVDAVVEICSEAEGGDKMEVLDAQPPVIVVGTPVCPRARPR